MSSWILRASSAFRRAVSGSGIPRSANTLPLPRVMVTSLLVAVLLMVFLRLFQPRLDEVDLGLGRADPAFRFLLEDVQDVDAPGKPHGEHGAVRPRLVVYPDLLDARTTEPLHGLHAGMPLAHLLHFPLTSH